MILKVAWDYNESESCEAVSVIVYSGQALPQPVPTVLLYCPENTSKPVEWAPTSIPAQSLTP